jgi:glycosyltransferase involved in cell wall biosynthesis
VCHTIDFARCGTCLAQFKYGQGAVERRMGGVIAGLRAGTGINLAPLARGAAAKLSKSSPAEAARASDADAAARFALLAEERSLSLRASVIPCVDLFLSPSRFLRERFIGEWGIPAEKIEHLRFGVDLDAFGARPRTHAAELRVAFIGSLVPIKGAHILLEAWGRIDPKLAARGKLSIFGPARHHPEYQSALAKRAAELGAIVGGELDRAGVAETLAGTDLLVVPSLWYENSPLVILEALASRTPLLVSDLGGMAELVEPGVSGFHFKMGDAGDLARKLELALDGRLGIERLEWNRASPPRFDDHVGAVEARYRAARTQRGGRK